MNPDGIARLVEPLLTGAGLELESVEIQPAGRRSVVRIFLDGDGADGRGPGVDEIASATRDISDALDAAPETGDAAYTLEVSSRGVTRPLTEPKHWRRNRGRLVKVTTIDDDGEPTVGRITGSDDEQVSLDVDGQTRTIAYDTVAKAVVQVEFRKKES